MRVAIGLSFHDETSFEEAVNSSFQFNVPGDDPNPILGTGPCISQDGSLHSGLDDPNACPEIVNTTPKERDDEIGGSDDIQMVYRWIYRVQWRSQHLLVNYSCVKGSVLSLSYLISPVIIISSVSLKSLISLRLVDGESGRTIGGQFGYTYPQRYIKLSYSLLPIPFSRCWGSGVRCAWPKGQSYLNRLTTTHLGRKWINFVLLQHRYLCTLQPSAQKNIERGGKGKKLSCMSGFCESALIRSFNVLIENAPREPGLNFLVCVPNGSRYQDPTLIACFDLSTPKRKPWWE